MAEVAGLILGAVGVAGVIGAFVDTLELFNMFADSRHLGRDYEILDTKLDIEKLLLLQWADRVRLLETNYDERLDDDGTRRVVSRTLDCIRQLLTDTSQLTARYGLGEATSIQVTSQSRQLARTPKLSYPRWDRFFKEIESGRFQATPLPVKVRWVIRDKQKFEGLLSEISYFVSKINEVVPVANDPKEDLEKVTDIRGLKILLEAATGPTGRKTVAGSYQARDIAEAAELQIKKMCQTQILNKLWFRKMDDRRESVAVAHHSTLQWALQPTSGAVKWDDLSLWLQRGSGIYWVVGKAGSGKSTLMKYLYSQERTKMLLTKWAAGDALLLCSFFFKNLGAEEQKSQEGLSRALLYQIFSSHPEIIEEALPNLWRETCAAGMDTVLPSWAETEYAFRVIATKGRELGRLCIFIDGLDEFTGDYRDVIRLIKDLSAAEHIKIIASSRPEPECVAAFSDLPKLRLQDLNRQDISNYVQDKVGSHKYMKRLYKADPQKVNEIIDDVINKSSGIFLWVVLACQSLLSGFADYDRLPELRRRVNELPPELADMFRLMLDKISPRHREQGSRLLRICYIQQTAELAHDCRDLYLLGLALVEDYHIDMKPIQPHTDEDMVALCEELEGRLMSRCGGLLEAVPGPSDPPCFCSPSCDDPTTSYVVTFLHRTVYEFLNDSEILNLECLKIPDDGFDPAVALSLYGLYLAKQCLNRTGGGRGSDVRSFFADGLRWASLVDSTQTNTAVDFFDELPSLLDDKKFIHSNHDRITRTAKFAQRSPSHRNCFDLPLLLAIETNSVNYLRRNLSRLRAAAGPSRTECDCKPILCHAVRGSLVSEGAPWSIDGWVETVQLLLQIGCDPNEAVSPVDPRTPWTQWLARMRNDGFGVVEGAVSACCTITELLLRAGAQYEGSEPHVSNVIRRILHTNNFKHDDVEQMETTLRVIQEIQDAGETRAAAEGTKGIPYLDEAPLELTKIKRTREARIKARVGGLSQPLTGKAWSKQGGDFEGLGRTQMGQMGM